MTTAISEDADFVGPIITVGEVADAAIEAAETDNPGIEIRVTPGPSYIRLEARGQIVLSVASLSQALGRPFVMGELEKNMPGFSGFIRMGSDSVKFVASRTNK